MGLFKSIKYYFLLFWYVLTSESTPIHKKILIIGTIIYFIVPIDLLPELYMPVLGITDDMAAFVAFFTTVKSAVTPEIKEKALKKIGR